MGAKPAARTNDRTLRLTQPLILGTACRFLRILRHTSHSQVNKPAARGIQPYCALLRSLQSQARKKKCCGCDAASFGKSSQPARELPMMVSKRTVSAKSCTSCWVGAWPQRVHRGFSGKIYKPQFSQYISASLLPSEETPPPRPRIVGGCEARANWSE